MGFEDELDEEPTATEIADACRADVDDDTYQSILELDGEDDLIDSVFALLLDAAIEDPEAYLISKGILLPTE
jgi:hypothetical protein